MHRITKWSASAGALAALANFGLSQYSATFEAPTYALGQLETQVNWLDWDGPNQNLTTVVNTQAHAGTRSIQVNLGADTVADFDHALGGGPYETGQWTLRAWSLVPNGSVGQTFFIVMNEWDVTGTPAPEWNLQMGLLANAPGQVRLFTPDGVKTTPLIFGAWTEIRADYDLDANSVTVYYGGTLLHTYDPRCGLTMGCPSLFTASRIDAIDLYPQPGSNPSPIFFDDVSIQASSGSPFTPVCFGDGSGTACPCGNDGGAGTGGGCANSAPMPAGQGARVSATGSNSIGADDAVLTADFTTNQPGLFFQGDNVIGGGNGIVFGDGLRCCGSNVIRLEIIDPPGTNGPQTVNTTAAIFGTSPPGTTDPGDSRCYQWWYRNPGRSLCGANFNLSNAVSVTWAP